MADYISKETAVTLLRDRAKQCRGMMGDLGGAVSGAAMLIESIPNTEVKPVVHGHWIEKELFIPWCDDDVDIIYECSRCETESGGTSPHCPNCGAKMDEVTNDENK